MPDIGIERLGPGYDQEDAAQNSKSEQSVVADQIDAVRRAQTAEH